MANAGGLSNSYKRSGWLGDFRRALWAGEGPNMMLPYGNVIRMHVMIFVFAGLYSAGLQAWAIYPVLLFYFFPLRSIAKELLERRKPGGAEAANAG